MIEHRYPSQANLGHNNLPNPVYEYDPPAIAGIQDNRQLASWLPDVYSQILSLYEFGPSGFKDNGSATLHCKI